MFGVNSVRHDLEAVQAHSHELMDSLLKRVQTLEALARTDAARAKSDLVVAQAHAAKLEAALRQLEAVAKTAEESAALKVAIAAAVAAL